MKERADAGAADDRGPRSRSQPGVELRAIRQAARMHKLAIDRDAGRRHTPASAIERGSVTFSKSTAMPSRDAASLTIASVVSQRLQPGP